MAGTEADELTCVICLAGDQRRNKLILTGCACRGSAARAHTACIASMAAHFAGTCSHRRPAPRACVTARPLARAGGMPRTGACLAARLMVSVVLCHLVCPRGCPR